MYQTGYLGIQALHANLPYMGGFCRFWYIQKEFIATWPVIDPATQFLSSEPTLVAGANWLGPVAVPKNQVGFSEVLKSDSAGLFYEQKISGAHPGDAADSRINYENLPWHQFVVVGQQRAGGLFLMLGNQDSTLDFVTEYATGPAGENVSATKFGFVGQSITKAPILTSFLGVNVAPSNIYSGGGVNTHGTNQTEIIPFTSTEGTKNIDWNAARILLFGQFPEIQVWITGASTELVTVPITADAAAPSQTLFTVSLPPEDGFIILK